MNEKKNAELQAANIIHPLYLLSYNSFPYILLLYKWIFAFVIKIHVSVFLFFRFFCNFVFILFII